MKCHRQLLMMLSVVCLWAARSIALGPEPGDVVVGRSAANQLKISPLFYVPDENITVLDPSGGILNGWTGTEPGFDHLVADDVANDIFPLQTGTQVRLELIAADPAFRAITSTFAIIDEPGERALLGGATLHTHLTWHINSDDANFDPLKVLWRATFKLVDTGATAYTDSPPMTFHFANVACSRGDCNGDGVIDGRDASGFVETLLDPVAATPEERCRADTNQDGYATAADVESFVAKLLSE